jgi:hypothetical protein
VSVVGGRAPARVGVVLTRDGGRLTEYLQYGSS